MKNKLYVKESQACSEQLREYASEVKTASLDLANIQSRISLKGDFQIVIVDQLKLADRLITQNASGFSQLSSALDDTIQNYLDNEQRIRFHTVLGDKLARKGWCKNVPKLDATPWWIHLRDKLIHLWEADEDAIVLKYDIEELIINVFGECGKIEIGARVCAGEDLNQAIADYALGYLQHNVDNRSVLGVFEALSEMQYYPKSKSNRNYKKNVEAWSEKYKELEEGRYIENQGDYTDMKYGDTTMKQAGCEIIATYNALLALKAKTKETTFPELIKSYEQKGMALSGNIGTSPRAINDYFVKQGYQVKTTKSSKEYDKVGKDYETFILTTYNSRNNIMAMVHTISITKDENGQFVMHNAGEFSNVPYSTLQDCIKKYNDEQSQTIQLIAIK